LPEAEPVAHKLIDAFRQSGFDLELGEGSLKVRIHPINSQLTIPMFFLTKRGEITFWPNTFARRAGQVGISPTLIAEYVAAMRRLLPQGSSDAWCHVQDADVSTIQAVVLEFQAKLANRGPSAE
jgi:hypothetical protein